MAGSAHRPALQPPLWHDRHQAGAELALRLQEWRCDPKAVVIGLPRGGVVVAAAVAEALELPLVSWSVRKLAQPMAPEVAVGAIGPGGVLLWDEPYLRQLHLDPLLRRRLVAEQDEELRRRQRLYGDPPGAALRGRDLLVVDDGVATGMTVRAALLSLRQIAPARLVLAVPVLDERMFARLAPQVDDLVALATVPVIQAVGLWYDRFEPVLDAQVLDLLAGARGLGRITGSDEISQGSA